MSRLVPWCLPSAPRPPSLLIARKASLKRGRTSATPCTQSSWRGPACARSSLRVVASSGALAGSCYKICRPHVLLLFSREWTCDECVGGINAIGDLITNPDTIQEVITFLKGEAFCGQHPDAAHCPQVRQLFYTVVLLSIQNDGTC